MHVYINGRFLTQAVTGVQRYAREIVKALDTLIESGQVQDLEVSLLAPQMPLLDLSLKHIKIRKIGRLKGHLWEQLELPFYTSGNPLVNLCNTGPALKTEQIVTLHDAAVYATPETFSKLFRTWYKLLLPTLGRRAKHLITISQFSKRELMKYCRIPEAKLSVTYQGSDQILQTQADARILHKHGLAGQAFALSVSSVKPNKNFATTLEAAKLLSHASYPIVIAGGTNPRVFGGFEHELPENVIYLGYVSDEELKSLYDCATCYISTSYYEGFGLTPLEAMACSCPVIVAQAASLPEVCGDAALYCDPYNPNDVASKIDQVMSTPALRQTLSTKGLERAGQFSWEACAYETLEIIRRTLL